MMTIAADGASTNYALAILLSKGSGAWPASGSDASGALAASNNATIGQDSATTIDLSQQAKALLQQSTVDPTTKLDLPASFDELVAKRTDDFAQSLVKAFTAEHIPLDDAISLRIDSSGNILADGPYKKRIEKYFKDNPEAAKEFKTVATLNALRAAQEALRLYNEEKKSATSKEQKAAAWDRYTARSMQIQALSGSLTLKDGQITSAALDYAKSLSDPAQALQQPQRTNVLV